MSVEEFYAFTDTQPDEEKSELIGGKLVLNAAPSRMHQWIVRDVVLALGFRDRELNAPWGCCRNWAFASPIRIGPNPTSWSFRPIIARSTQGARRW